MSDIREVLAAALARSRRGVTAKVNDNDRAQADDILRDFLVVPRYRREAVKAVVELHSDAEAWPWPWPLPPPIPLGEVP